MLVQPAFVRRQILNGFFFLLPKCIRNTELHFVTPKPMCTKDGQNSTNVDILGYCPVSGQDCPQFFCLIIYFIVHIIFLKGCLLPEKEIAFKDLCCFYLSSVHPVDFPRFALHAHETQSIWDLLLF